MKKRLVAMAFAMSAMLAMFAQGKAEKPATTQQKDDGPVPITMLIETQAVQVDKSSPIMQMIDTKYNIDLDAWELDPKKFDEQLNVRFAGGEMPDIFTTNTTANLPSYVEGGIAAEIPVSLIREKAPHYAEAVDRIDPTIWDAMTYNGKNYGYAQPMAIYPMAVFWNQNWLDKLGLQPPTTLEEMEKVLLAFVNDDPDGDGKNDTAGMAERTFGAIFGAYGVRCVTGGNTGFKVEEMQLDEQGLPFFPYITERAKEALTLLHKWYELGIVDKEFVTGENHGGYSWDSHSFMNGRIGVTCAQPSHYFMTSLDDSDPKNLGRCMRDYKAIDPNAKVTIGPAPIGPYGDQGTEAWAPVGKLVVVTQKAMEDPRKIDAILKMLDDFYADPDFAMTLTYGIKDVDWKETPYGPVRLTDGKEARRKGIIQFGYGNTAVFAAQARQAQDSFGKSVTQHGYPRILVPNVPEFSNCIATLDTLTEQAYYDMITGTKPMSYFDTFVQEFKAAGGEAAEKAIREAAAAKMKH